MPPEGAKDERLSKDLEQSTAVMKAFDTREGFAEGSNAVVAALDSCEAATIEQKLDLVLWHLLRPSLSETVSENAPEMCPCSS